MTFAGNCRAETAAIFSPMRLALFSLILLALTAGIAAEPVQIVISGADAVAIDGGAVTVRALAADQLGPRVVP